eukprot:COSAG04_NODE_5725_length_1511_cov_1.256374_2_plen_30_part_01
MKNSRKSGPTTAVTVTIPITTSSFAVIPST